MSLKCCYNGLGNLTLWLPRKIKKISRDVSRMLRLGDKPKFKERGVLARRHRTSTRWWHERSVITERARDIQLGSGAADELASNHWSRLHEAHRQKTKVANRRWPLALF